MALRRFAEPEELFGIRADGDDTGSLDGVANAAIDRFGDSRSTVDMDAACVGETPIDRWEDNWRGRHSHEVGESHRHRDADAGGSLDVAGSCFLARFLV